MMFQKLKTALGNFFKFSKNSKSKLKDVNERAIKWLFLQYFENNCIAYQAWGIHLIEAKTLDSGIIITVTLSRPGLLIGKAGSRIDDITTYFSNYFGKPVEIRIKEFDTFN